MCFCEQWNFGLMWKLKKLFRHFLQIVIEKKFEFGLFKQKGDNDSTVCVFLGQTESQVSGRIVYNLGRILPNCLFFVRTKKNTYGMPIIFFVRFLNKCVLVLSYLRPISGEAFPKAELKTVYYLEHLFKIQNCVWGHLSFSP